MKIIIGILATSLILGCGKDERVSAPVEPSWPPGQDLKSLSTQEEHEVLYLFKALSDFEVVSTRLLEVSSDAPSPMSLASVENGFFGGGTDGERDRRFHDVPGEYLGNPDDISQHLFSGPCNRSKKKGIQKSYKTSGEGCSLHWTATHNYTEEKKLEKTTGTLQVKSDFFVGEDFDLDFGIKEFRNDGEGKFSLSVSPDFSYQFEGSGQSKGFGEFFGRNIEVVRKVSGKNSRTVLDRDSDGNPTYFAEKHLQAREFEIYIEGVKKGHIAIEESWEGIMESTLRVAFNGQEIDEEWRIREWGYSDLITAIYGLEVPLEYPEIPEPK